MEDNITELTPTDFSLMSSKYSTFVVPADEEDGFPEQEFHIHKFSFAKTMLVLEGLAGLAEKVDLAGLFSDTNGIRFDMLVEKIPLLLRVGRPMLFRTFAIILIKNKDIARISEDEDALEVAIAPYKEVIYRLDMDKATELLRIGIERVGVQDIRKNFPSLLNGIMAVS